MWAKPSGNFGVEFCNNCRPFWLGTYPTTDEAAHAYDMAVWHAGRPRTELNFPEIETWADAEFLVPKNFRMEEMTKAIHIAPGKSDEAAIARFTREHLEYFQAEREIYWKHEAEQKKKED